MKKINKLRSEAERIFELQKSDVNIEEYKNNVLGLVEELSIYQIELELQNDELRSKQLELANEKQRFEDLYLNAPVGYFLFNENGIILDMNKKANEILGIYPNVSKNQPFIAFLSGDTTHSDFMKHLKEVFDNQDIEEKEVELVIKNADSCPRYIRLTSNILQKKYCRSLAEDITEKKTYQLKMELLSNRLHAAMFAGDMAWWELELPSGNVYFNDNKTLMLGYEPSDFTHYNDFMQIVHPDDYERTMEAFRQHINGCEDVYDAEYRIRSSKGDYLWFHDIGRIINRDQNGIKLTGIVTNITKQKQNEIELRDSELRLKTIISTLPDLLFHFDKDGRFLTFFQDSPNLFTKPDEFLNKTIYDIFDKETAEAFQNCIDQTLKHSSYEYNYELQIDELRHFHAKYSKLNENEIIALVRDVTEQKKAENTITSQNIKLKELNATKDKFFSIIAHDLKNPFNSILNYSELLADYHKRYDESKTNEMINSIRNSAKNTYKLLENLLTWSRAQTGKIDYNADVFNLNLLVMESIQLLDQTANSKELKVINNIKGNIFVEADTNTVGTVIRNLLSNAYKFTPRRGEILIDAEVITKDGEKFIQICISDSGIGIPEERLPKLFDIGTSSSTKGTDNETGTGLGLILCKEFVEKNGGDLWVESKINEGSKFFFTLQYTEEVMNKFDSVIISNKSLIPDIKLEINEKLGDSWDIAMQELKEKYRIVRKTNSFESIQIFANSLIAFCKKYELTKLKTLGDILIEFINEFDIENINKTLDIIKPLFDE